MKYLICLMLLTGCATPETILVSHDKVVKCGGTATGSLMGGMIGYGIQRHSDDECVRDAKAKGFKDATP